MGGNQTIAPEKKRPMYRVKVWVRVSFGVGRGAIFVGGNWPRTVYEYILIIYINNNKKIAPF